MIVSSTAVAFLLLSTVWARNNNNGHHRVHQKSRQHVHGVDPQFLRSSNAAVDATATHRRLPPKECVDTPGASCSGGTSCCDGLSCIGSGSSKTCELVTTEPTSSPIASPTKSPTSNPTFSPTKSPTSSPAFSPTKSPTPGPTIPPTTGTEQCVDANPISCGCDDVLQADYRGDIHTTAAGIECQRWDSQSPHAHDRTPQNYPSEGLDENFCRNPDGEPGGAWCYTTDVNTRWAYCDVPSCPYSPPPATSSPTGAPTKIPTSMPVTPAPTSSLPMCSVPEYTSIELWASDMRETIQNANLPSTTGGTVSATGNCQSDVTKQKVLLIGVDGLRADVIGMIPLPNIRKLQSMGTYSFFANVQTTAVASSGPGWASMFTGVEPSKHLVDGNGDLTDIAYPTVFKLVKEKFGKKIAASVSWHPLFTDIINYEDSTTLDASYLAPNDAEMAAQAESWILSEQYDFIFVDFDGPDAAGHSNGFDGYLFSYQDRVRTTDTLIGKLLDAVSNTSSGEEWLIVLTTDHGGEGTTHGPQDAYNRKIPFIVASNSPRVNIGYMPYLDPGSQMDVLPTIMHFFGGPSAIPSGLDGQVFGFRDYTRGPPTGSCIADPNTCGCDVYQQADYRGTISVTKSGLTCQRWDSQEPHGHIRTPENYPSAGLVDNFCRNPDGEPQAWCYTTDIFVRFEMCDVPSCPTV